MTYTSAQTLPLQAVGRDGQLVSRIALGCMGLSGTRNPAAITREHRRAAIRAFEAALEAGITLFDHADIYGGGGSEEHEEQATSKHGGLLPLHRRSSS